MRPSKNKNNEKDKPFVGRRAFIENQRIQIHMAPITLGHLRSYGVPDDRELKIEFFFYSKTQAKADALANALRVRNYEVETMDSAGDNDLILVNGWTTKMKMDDEIVQRWTEDMCELGYTHDCQFDGWGTTPDQE